MSGNGDQCRICLDNEHSEDLFQPCLCTGTMQCVHRSCLHRWRLSQTNPSAYRECPQCKYTYHLKRVPLADFLASPLTSRSLTVLILALCITPCAAFAKHFLGHFFNNNPLAPSSLVWLQAIFAGAVIFGLGVLVIVALYTGPVNMLYMVFDAVRAILKEFWHSDENYTPGAVIVGFAYLALELARFGLYFAGACVLCGVSKAVGRALQKMEKLVLGQVEDIRTAEPRTPSVPEVLACNLSKMLSWLRSSHGGDPEEEEEEEEW